MRAIRVSEDHKNLSGTYDRLRPDSLSRELKEPFSGSGMPFKGVLKTLKRNLGDLRVAIPFIRITPCDSLRIYVCFSGCRGEDRGD